MSEIDTQDVYPLKTGNLIKRRRGFPFIWQERSFSLFADRIEYYSKGNLKGTVGLRRSTRVEKVSLERDYGFRITTRERGAGWGVGGLSLGALGVLDIVVRVSEKPYVGTIIAVLDADNDITLWASLYYDDEKAAEKDRNFELDHRTILRHEVLKTERDSVYKSQNSRASMGRKSMAGARRGSIAKKELDTICINVINIYEDENTIRVVAGCDHNAILVWEVWNKEQGLGNHKCQEIVLPARKLKKEQMAELKKMAMDNAEEFMKTAGDNVKEEEV
ncbi:hypothetical protein B484DRAFT_480494 [Ochromonadaceae sp. CCMP2298]|nr:hypothetical protein B484DRAFT_480494 [Ochromonadaceae sp. CCMP2298]